MVMFVAAAVCDDENIDDDDDYCDRFGFCMCNTLLLLTKHELKQYYQGFG